MRPPLAWRVFPPPKRPSASRSYALCPGMPGHGRPSGASPSKRRWNARSSTACTPPPATPSPRCSRISSPPSRTALNSAAMAWPRVHATNLATSQHPLSLRPDECPGSRGPSLRRPPRDVIPPGSGCTRAYIHSTLPCPLFPSTRCQPTSSTSRWFLAVEGGVGCCFSSWRFLSPSLFPLRSPWSVPPFRARAAYSPSASPLLPLASPVSSAARPVGSGARRWRTAPDTDAVLQDDWYPHSQQMPPERQGSCAGAVVFAAGAIPSFFPLSVYK